MQQAVISRLMLLLNTFGRLNAAQKNVLCKQN